MPVSHPSLRRSPLQSAKPMAQVALQIPPAQLAATTFWFEQAALQPPQLAASIAIAASQPLAASPSQSANAPSGQVTRHFPLSQLGLAWLREQAVPHAPQLAVSL